MVRAASPAPSISTARQLSGRRPATTSPHSMSSTPITSRLDQVQIIELAGRADPVEIGVEQRHEPVAVVAGQDETRRGDRFRHADALADAGGQDRLAGPQGTGEEDDVARLHQSGQGPADPARVARGSGLDSDHPNRPSWFVGVGRARLAGLRIRVRQPLPGRFVPPARGRP